MRPPGSAAELPSAMVRAGLEGTGTRPEHARAMAADLVDRL
ncbi:hypothetical protein [Streptomyces sclerotialus]